MHARAYLCRPEPSAEATRQKLATSFRSSLVQTASVGSARNESFIEMLAAQTFLAEASGTLLAKTPEMDLLLRLAGTTQISKAIAEKGSAPGKPFLLIVAGARTKVRGVGAELPRRRLSEAELQRVEEAALLSAQRA